MSFLRWVPLAFVLGLVVLFAVALFIDRPSEGSLALVGQPAPEFLLPALAPETGVGFAHADLLEAPVSIVNVWASWCGPCVVEHPQLMALSEEPGVQVFGINYRDRPEAARAFLEEWAIPMTGWGWMKTAACLWIGVLPGLRRPLWWPATARSSPNTLAR